MEKTDQSSKSEAMTEFLRAKNESLEAMAEMDNSNDPYLIAARLRAQGRLPESNELSQPPKSK